MSPTDPLAPLHAHRQTVVIAGVVIALHTAAIWAIQHATASSVQPQIIAAEVIAQLIAPPAPHTPAAAPPAPPAPQPKPTVKPALKSPAKPPPATPPLPVAVADPTPAPKAPTGALEQPATPKPISESAAPSAPAAPPAPAPKAAQPAGSDVQLPSSNAAYLNNPRPSYPATSRRMGEQGKVLLRVLVDENGLPQQIEIKQSSGFERLDKAALASVQRWRFVPGKRNGIAEAMWNIVPVNFVLE